MTPAAIKFFEYAANKVTVKDVERFCPNDPGYLDYIREFTTILTSRVIPSEFEFDVTETISLTLWGNPEKEYQEQDAIRFRRFRIFSNAVALAIILGPDEDGWNMGCNYYAISLLADIEALEDDHLYDLLPPVLMEMHQKLSQSGSAKEAVFYLMAQLFLALMGHAPNVNLNELADQLINEESKLDANKDDRQGFLWQRTVFDQMHHQWKEYAEKLVPPSNSQDSVSRLRDVLLSQDGTTWVQMPGK